jgi:hypothetical protein
MENIRLHNKLKELLDIKAILEDRIHILNKTITRTLETFKKAELEIGLRESERELQYTEEKIDGIKKEIERAERKEIEKKYPIEKIRAQTNERLKVFGPSDKLSMMIEELSVSLNSKIRKFETLQGKAFELQKEIYGSEEELSDDFTKAKGIADMLRHFPQIPHPTSKPFMDELIEFKRLVEAEFFKKFWKGSGGRRGKNFISNPEQFAQLLLLFYFGVKVGSGNIFKEIPTGGGRIDVVITYLGENYIVEIKMLGGHYTINYALSGIEQLSYYIQNRDAQKGYLIVFDGRCDDQKKSTLPDEENRNGNLIKIIDISINPSAPSKKARKIKPRVE